MFKFDEKLEDKLAIVDDESVITFSELDMFSNTFGERLTQRAVMFILCENSIGAIAGYIACIKNRIVPLLLNAELDKTLYKALLNSYSPQYIWKPKKMVGEVESGGKVYEEYGYALIKTENKNYSVSKELALLMPTSGTTGDPKVVRHSYANLESSAKNVSCFFGLKTDDRGMVQLPIQYTMGLSTVCSHLYVGATVLLTKYSLTQSEFWDFFEGQRATTFTGVPFSYEVLSKLGFFRRENSHLRLLAQGGGKMNDKLFQQIAYYSEQYGKQFFATFGTTETTSRLSYLPPSLANKKIGSIGNAIPEGKLSLIDSEGNTISENGVEGELVYQGPNVMLGYATSLDDLNRPDECKMTYATGDIAVRDSQGYYFIKGRKSRFLKLYGLRVSLDQTESLVRDFLETECACTGTDEGMHIFITEEKGEDVARYISQKIGVPNTIFNVHVVQEIPRKSTGKIDYAVLDFNIRKG